MEELTHIIHVGRKAGKSIVIATHNIEWIERHASTLELFTKDGKIWEKGSVQYFQNEEFRAQWHPYKTFEIEIPDRKVKEQLRAQLRRLKRVNLNPAVQGDWIQLRAQVPEFENISHLF